MQKNQALKQSCLLGLFFLTLFTSNASFSTIITQIHQQDGNSDLGPFLLSFYYTFYMLANIISPSITLKYKTQMTIAPLLYSMNYFTGFILPFCDLLITRYIITAIGAMLGGFGAAILWTSLGGFLHQLCQKYQVQTTKGKYFGVFNGIFCIQSISGSFITTFGLGYFEESTYFIIITVIAIFSSLICHLVIQDVQNQQDSIQIDQNKILIQIIKAKKQHFSFKKACKKLWGFYPKMVHTIPIIFIDGLSIGFINSSMTHLIPGSDSHQQANFKAGLCFSLYGCGAIFGGYISSIFTDYYSIKKTGYFNAYIFLLTLLVTYLCIGTTSYIFVLTVFFLWGLQLYYIQGWMMIICSKLYGGALQSFAINKQVHSFSFVLYEIFIISNQNKVDLQYLLPFLGIFVVPVFLGLNTIQKMQDLNVKSINIQKASLKEESHNQNSIFTGRLKSNNLQAQKLIQNQQK